MEKQVETTTKASQSVFVRQLFRTLAGIAETLRARKMNLFLSFLFHSKVHKKYSHSGTYRVNVGGDVHIDSSSAKKRVDEYFQILGVLSELVVAVFALLKDARIGKSSKNLVSWLRDLA